MWLQMRQTKANCPSLAHFALALQNLSDGLEELNGSQHTGLQRDRRNAAKTQSDVKARGMESSAPVVAGFGLSHTDERDTLD